jgi:hypothetical protein
LNHPGLLATGMAVYGLLPVCKYSVFSAGGFDCSRISGLLLLHLL